MGHFSYDDLSGQLNLKNSCFYNGCNGFWSYHKLLYFTFRSPRLQGQIYMDITILHLSQILSQMKNWNYDIYIKWIDKYTNNCISCLCIYIYVYRYVKNSLVQMLCINTGTVQTALKKHVKLIHVHWCHY